jgi:hypothetical protein
MLAVCFLRRNGEGHGIADLGAFQPGIQARDHVSPAEDERKRPALLRITEIDAVGGLETIFDCYLLVLFSYHE